MIKDYNIIKKTNQGKFKITNIYVVAQKLTVENIKKLINGKKVRKGNNLYYIEKI